MKSTYNFLYLLSITTLLVFSACSVESQSTQTETAKAASEIVDQTIETEATASRFSAIAIEESIKILSSDEFEGRGPVSKGETLTINYLAEALKDAGYSPGNGDSYFQDVPLVSMLTSPDTGLNISVADTQISLPYADSSILWTKRVSEKEALDNSELVFVGYGIVAPEYNWNDYAGLDMQGKTAVILVNDPGYATQDKNLFNGNAMTYYGRWTYKYEEAARQGAAGAIIIHEEEAAGYPWEVVTGSWSGPQFDLVAEDKNMSRVAIEGWIHQSQAEKLFNAAGQDLSSLKTLAKNNSFKPVSLNATVNSTINNTYEKTVSKNVIGILTGSKYPDEYVIYMAHWDHLGIDQEKQDKEGDGIYNGAVDNASGTAAVLEIGKAFASLEQKPERSIVILFVTAEEKGLLGSKHYAVNPVYSHTQTAAGFNIDGLNLNGRTKNISVVGFGNSELENYLKTSADKQDRVLEREASPEKGYFYRSDHFNFAKVGVPVLYAKSGNNFIGQAEDYGDELAKDYVSKRYHKVKDEFKPDWDYSGAMEDMELLFDIGNTIANERSFPNWFEGNEFRSIRDESRK